MNMNIHKYTHTHIHTPIATRAPFAITWFRPVTGLRLWARAWPAGTYSCVWKFQLYSATCGRKLCVHIFTLTHVYVYMFLYMYTYVYTWSGGEFVRLHFPAKNKFVVLFWSAPLVSPVECDMAHARVRYDSFIYIYTWHDSFICMTRLTHIYGTTHSFVWRIMFIREIWLIHTSDMNDSNKWHDSIMRLTYASFRWVTWLILLCDLRASCEVLARSVRFPSFWCISFSLELCHDIHDIHVNTDEDTHTDTDKNTDMDTEMDMDTRRRTQDNRNASIGIEYMNISMYTYKYNANMHVCIQIYMYIYTHAYLDMFLFVNMHIFIYVH